MLQPINHHKVRAIPLPHLDKRPVKGAEICNKAYGAVFTVAKRESGKTAVVYYIIDHCTSKKTNIIVFCSTLYNDANWIQIRKKLEARGNPTEYFTSAFEDGEDQIRNLVTRFTDEAKDREDEEGDTEEVPCADKICAYFDKHHLNKEDDDTQHKKEKKEKYLTPKHVIIFDDMSGELRSPSLIKLLKESRHFLAKVIISSQYLHDLKPETLSQIDLWLIFKGQPDAKLATILERSDLDIPFEKFKRAYDIATEPKKNDTHPFLYVDVRKNELRRNFNYSIRLKETAKDEK
jgi:hypothetical protein